MLMRIRYNLIGEKKYVKTALCHLYATASNSFVLSYLKSKNYSTKSGTETSIILTFIWDAVIQNDKKGFYFELS